MGKIIGIDLGTTNSVVSVMEGGSATVISTAEGGRLCPSVVAFNKNGERLVGQTAKRQAVVNSENTVYSIKRFIGRHFEETEVERKMVSYEVVKGPSDDVRVKIPITGREYSPQEISAMILGKLKADAEAKRQATGARVLGRRAILDQDWRDSPSSYEPRRELNPRVAAKNKWSRIEALQRARGFGNGYRSAFEAFRRGIKDVLFPAGTYWLRRFASVPIVN